MATRSTQEVLSDIAAALSVPLVRVAVIVNDPVFEIVTEWVARTPAVNAAVVPLPEVSVPVEVMSTVPVKPVRSE